MKKGTLVEYFEEVETEREYNGYFCSIPEAISIVFVGSIVADALNCQKETAEAIIHGNGDYLLDAKGNQPTLDNVLHRSCR